MARKAKQKKQKRSAKKSSPKAKMSAKKTANRGTARKTTARKRPTRQRPTAMGSQSVETVQLRPRARTARAGAGGGDFGGTSVIEGADSESPNELLEEGQTFEAGVVSGVQNAPDADQGEVRTHEVQQDDVPEEYDDKDRP